jgi:small subunit ribosomal protein S20
MAITKSAKKALRVSTRKRVFNLRGQRAMKEGIKAVQKMAGSGMTKEAAKALAAAYQAIDKAAKKGLLKKNTAARQKSRLSRLLKKVK